VLVVVRKTRRFWSVVLILLPILAAAGCLGIRNLESSGDTARQITVGVSNGYIGNGWRTQMIDDIEKQAELYKSKGWIKELIVQNAGNDVNNQISQIRNLIEKKVDLLLINPNSQNELNPVIEEAYRKGIRVIAFDQAVTSPYALNVVINQKEWGARQAEWLCEQLQGQGKIVIIGGLASNPANIDRIKGMKEVLARYPNIKVLAEGNGDWDHIVARRVMADILASYTDIDGVLTQDAMSLGVVKAYQAADKPIPVITGETRVVFLRKWKQLKDSGQFSSYGQNNPPGIGATALGIGVRLVEGKQWRAAPPDHTFHYWVKTHVTNANLEEELQKLKDKPDTYFNDEWLSESEMDNLFQ
jgi:ribose transport system substrate-binding protein